MLVENDPKVQAKLVEMAKKNQSIADNLPSWDQVDSAISAIANLNDAKAFIKKLSRVVYWLAKNSEQ